MTKFRKDDLVIGGTKLDQALNGAAGPQNQGMGGNSEILNALNNIATLLSQPGQVMLDGRKVGETMAMAKSYVDR